MWWCAAGMKWRTMIFLRCWTMCWTWLVTRSSSMLDIHRELWLHSLGSLMTMSLLARFMPVSFIRSFIAVCRAHCVENVESEALNCWHSVLFTSELWWLCGRLLLCVILCIPVVQSGMHTHIWAVNRSLRPRIYIDAGVTVRTQVINSIRACFAVLRQIRSMWRSLPQHVLLSDPNASHHSVGSV